MDWLRTLSGEEKHSMINGIIGEASISLFYIFSLAFSGF
jgi:hypothetical protein